MTLSREAVYCLLLFIVSVWIISRIESVFIFILFVMVISYAIYPMVRWCEGKSKGIKRQVIILFIYLTLLMAGIGFAILIVPPIARQMKELTGKLPEYANTLKVTLSEFLARYQTEHPGANWIDTITKQIESAYSQAASIGLTATGIFLSGAMEGLIYLLLLPLVVFYVLIEHSSIKSGFIAIIPLKYRALSLEFLNGANHILEKFIKGYILLSLITGIIVTFLFLPLIPKYALALGFIAALVKPLPFLGPILGSIPILVVGLATAGPLKAFIALSLYVLTQTLDDFTIAPKIMGQALQLHPLTILIGVMILHKIMGVWGAFIAAPTLAVIKLGVQLIVARLNTTT